MAVSELTIDDLRLILREGAGADEGVDLDGDIMDVPFDELGYDSLALLETGSRIGRKFDVQLEDATFTDAETPRALIKAVNEQLAANA
jgi:act minimal PKS acyl carrier protein